jgi:hypothetical protein
MYLAGLFSCVACAPDVFGLTQSLLRLVTDALYPRHRQKDAKGGNMTTDREALIAVAERIAEAENRVSQLRERVTRLRDEGSDASQAQETLQVVSRNLSNLYVRQSLMRRTVWVWQSTKAG